MTSHSNDAAVAARVPTPTADDVPTGATLNALQRGAEGDGDGMTLVHRMRSGAGRPPVTRAAAEPATAEAGAVAQATAEVDAVSSAHRSGASFLQLLWVAYVVFFIAAMPLLAVGGLQMFVSMAMSGCVTGIVWQLVPRRRRSCAWSAVAVYAVLVVGPRLDSLGQRPLEVLMLVVGVGLVGWLGSLAPRHCPGRRLASARAEQGAGSAP